MLEVDPSRQIPVTLLTGFLGAGKTTLLNHLLKQPEMASAAVLINEFGEVGIDHYLVDNVDDNILLLDSGCLCCSVRGDLARALRELFMKRLRREISAFSRVLIETTGLADPAPVIYTLIEDFFIAERFRSDGIITAVDVTHIVGQLAAHAEAIKQVAMADRLLLTKCDLASDECIAIAAQSVADINPGAPQVEVRSGKITPSAVAGCGLYDPATKQADVVRWLAEERVLAAGTDTDSGTNIHAHRHNRHSQGVHSFVLRFANPLVWAEFTEAIDVLLSTCGDRILRVKGLLNIEGEGAPRVIHCVQHVRYPVGVLSEWPKTGKGGLEDRDSRLVFIVRNLQREYVEKTFVMFCSARIQ